MKSWFGFLEPTPMNKGTHAYRWVDTEINTDTDLYAYVYVCVFASQFRRYLYISNNEYK